METYLVGGAVRDKLLNLPVKEQDWVVVGSTPKQMLEQGFKVIGKDFPVFLHPETKEEYALARTERKAGHGYKGFEFHATPDVTLEQDLQRRDLTINAIAETADGRLIDPYGGQQDLQHGLLRHVSDAFTEDPVRVLRIARFNARFAGEGFHVAPDTEKLLQSMAKSGELDHLTAERVWQEMRKALSYAYPSSFFAVLHDCGALAIIFPELTRIFTDDIMATLQHAVLLSDSINVRFAALGQFIEPDAVEQLCLRLGLPNDAKQLTLAVCRWHKTYAQAHLNTAEQILALLNSVDVWRNPQRFDDFLLACQADVNLREAKQINRFWCQALLAAKTIDIKALSKQYDGKALGEAISLARLAALKSFRS